MSFDEALDNCCEMCEPDLYRYFASPMVDERFGNLVANVDHDVEKTKTGMKVTSVSSPLIYEPKFTGKLSGKHETAPLRQSQQAADQAKRSKRPNESYGSLCPEKASSHESDSDRHARKQPAQQSPDRNAEKSRNDRSSSSPEQSRQKQTRPYSRY